MVLLTHIRFDTGHMKDLMACRGAILWNTVSFIDEKQTSILNIKLSIVSASTMRDKDENDQLLTFERLQLKLN